MSTTLDYYKYALRYIEEHRNAYADDIDEWIESQHGKVRWDRRPARYYIFFENELDATMFVLKWGVK